MERASPSRRSRAARWTGIALLVVVAAAAFVAGLAYGQAQALVGELQAGEKRAAVNAVRRELDVLPHRPALPPEPRRVTTYLLVGSDRRIGRKERLSDTIILARIDARAARIALLSIPRDLYVEIPGHGHGRVNEAYRRGGVALLARTVRETIGVEINHVVDVDFRGFRQLVGELGGVYIPVDQRYFNRNVGTPDTNYAKIDLRPGYQRLNADDALAFVRYRHGDTDLLRAARQQLFLREAARQAAAARTSFGRLRRAVVAFARATTSDLDSIGEVWDVLAAVEKTPPSRIARVRVPTSDFVQDGAAYLRSTPTQIRRAVLRWRGTAATPAPAATPATTAPHTATAARRRARAPMRRVSPARLLADGGTGRSLVARFGGRAPCAPTALPPGFAWAEEDAARAYELDRHPAVALSATRGSGRSLLWMMTTLPDPPILERPSTTVRRGRREYDLYFENGRLRQVAWRMGAAHVWITNTLANEVGIEEMLQLAVTCRAR